MKPYDQPIIVIVLKVLAVLSAFGGIVTAWAVMPEDPFADHGAATPLVRLQFRLAIEYLAAGLVGAVITYAVAVLVDLLAQIRHHLGGPVERHEAGPSYSARESEPAGRVGWLSSFPQQSTPLKERDRQRHANPSESETRNRD